MIFQYMQEVSMSFYNFAWQYSAVVQSNANVQAAQDIIDEYTHLPKAYSLPALRNRKQIAIR